jgi:hypothetical protein
LTWTPGTARVIGVWFGALGEITLRSVVGVNAPAGSPRGQHLGAAGVSDPRNCRDGAPRRQEEIHQVLIGHADSTVRCTLRATP